jgi:hypothetical protein
MELNSSIAARIVSAFNRLLRHNADPESWAIYDYELGAEASCCATSTAACL